MEHSQCRIPVNTPSAASADSAVPENPNSVSKSYDLVTLRNITTPHFICQVFFLRSPEFGKMRFHPYNMRVL